MPEYRFILTEQEINYILELLGQRPYVEVAALIAKIHRQAEEPILKESNGGT